MGAASVPYDPVPGETWSEPWPPAEPSNGPSTEPSNGPPAEPSNGPFIEPPATPPPPAEAPAVPQPAGADLSVRITSYPKVAQPGRPLGYRIDVGNAGPGPAVRPELRVRLPEGVKVLSVDVAECKPGTTARLSEIVCSSGADVLKGGHGTLSVVGQVPADARGALRAVATIKSQAADGDATDNTAEAVNRVGEGADLAVRLTRLGGGPAQGSARGSRRAAVAAPGRRAPGARVRAVVMNHGPQAVRDGQLFVRVRGARLVASEGARCGAHAGYVGCRLHAVPVGGGTRVLMVFAPAANARHARPMTAAAMVYSAVLGDRRPDNGKARLRVPLRPS
ncbi:hypothetical protein DP939_30125 [Spongiactinospora rosea]|uniref:DUF11 domain-containing protein n=1 Tax=Spongiactinospora rosea TaxID=2248750 RepID=A0A366LRP2_9ACTN|nr:hypothetical protein DP939_30125 [Spongiactinospora rosea]